MNGGHASAVVLRLLFCHFDNAHCDGKFMHNSLCESLCTLVETSKGSQCRLTQADATIIRRDGAVGPKVQRRGRCQVVKVSQQQFVLENSAGKNDSIGRVVLTDC